MSGATQLRRARRLLCQLQAHIRDKIVAARRREASKFAWIVGITEADTIYHVDKLGEAAILDWFEEYWPKSWPVELVMEGLPDGGVTTFPRGMPPERTEWTCILDPIDGTRGLMYDKRAAFILAGLAQRCGKRPQHGDIVVAAMTEIPTSKADRADQLSAIRGNGMVAETHDLARGTRRRWIPRPSQAKNFEHGFASLARFFPEGKTLLSQVEESLWRELDVLGERGGALVFDDQYISTGGQLYELIVGHDRMLGDLRPLAYAKLGLVNASLCCHPYDICTALIAQEAGCVVESPEGKTLRLPLDTTTSVSWMSYANPTLARMVRPALRRVLRQYF